MNFIVVCINTMYFQYFMIEKERLPFFIYVGSCDAYL